MDKPPSTAIEEIQCPPSAALENNSITPAYLTLQASKYLLDFNQKLDIDLLDKVIDCLYDSSSPERLQVAQSILTSLKEHPNSWTRVDTILEYSKNPQTRFFALQILESVIKTRWKALPQNQREGIKKYIVSLIIKTSSDPETMAKEKVYLNKLNIALVQILKREWPKQWPNFITDIVGASKTNESLCQNNMIILKLLSEEVFDYSQGQMIQAKVNKLKDKMCAEFLQVFELCHFVMENSQNAALIECTLETLLRFLNWIPFGYIFETKLISTLVFKFLSVKQFVNVTLKCLTEIAGIQERIYNDVFIGLFLQTVRQLESFLPTDVEWFAHPDSQPIAQNLALFLCTFLREHDNLIETPLHQDVLMLALEVLINISTHGDVETFKICLEYWYSLTLNLFYQFPSSSQAPFYYNTSQPFRRQLYDPILSKLRYLIIGRMAKPEEVLVVENEQGEVVREFMKDTDAIQLYKSMRETLVFLTHLDCADTEKIMTDKLVNQVNGSEWSWKNLNTLCWAIGSISGAMSEDDERQFLVTVIKDLLGLCEQKRGKNNKAIIASNIMYVVGQYPRFLRAHWKFLKTVVSKLFEFMHETHEGVQDMACDTFIKIAQKCRRHFIQFQLSEPAPFVEEILSDITSIICDLQPQQVHTVYEAIGYMICAETSLPAQNALIEKYMRLPNQVWDDIIDQAFKNVDVLKDPAAVKQLGNILKTNVRACKALGHAYVQQLRRIYLDMLNVYKVMSENITAAISMNGESVTKQPLIRSMRTVKKETLKLISGWISRSTNAEMVNESFLPPLLDAVLLDYQRCPVPSAREPEVLSTLTAIVIRLEMFITSEIPKIFDAVFECTLEMINKDFHEYPEYRTNFFLFLHQIVSCCFSSLFMLPPNQFKLVLDSVIWAVKHTMRNVADTGLQILYNILMSISCEEEAALQSFHQTYYLDIMQHVFSVVTDSSHSAGLSMQVTILSHMFFIVHDNQITVPLNPAVQEQTGQNNVEYVTEFVSRFLKNAYPHLTDNQVQQVVNGFFSFCSVPTFKQHLRDFLIQIREITGEDDSDLYLEERQELARRAQAEREERMRVVPGLMNPHDIDDLEMQ